MTALCGYALVHTGILPRIQWGGIETLAYWLLIPAVLIKSIAESELSLSEFGRMLVALLLALGVSGMIVLGLRWWQSPEKLSNPVFTTLFQTTTRWNVFITLAAVDLIVGPQRLALVTLTIAVLVPLMNIANVLVLAFFGSAQEQDTPVATHVLKNSLVQACAIGIAINLTGGAPTEPCTANARFDWTGRSWCRDLGRWRRGQWRAAVATINRYGLWCYIPNDVRPSHISGCGNWIWFGADRGFNSHHGSSGSSRIQRIYTGQENGR